MSDLYQGKDPRERLLSFTNLIVDTDHISLLLQENPTVKSKVA
ncbi:MAG: hypothetical protein SWZ49_30765 [Cyanobacteriota bacterium]|nr:hypothetical protein [Cyanobacteriota bacterium]